MRLTRAAFLTVRRRRALVVWAAVLAVGAPLALELVLLALHASDPANRPAGGSATFSKVLATSDIAVAVAAAMVGATAGAGDLAAGTFRDLVSTGRPRHQLLLARVPAALGLVLPLTAVGVAIEAACAYALADGAPTPSAGEALGMAGHALAVASVCTVVAVGLAELVGSRGIAIGVFLGWVLGAELLIENVTLLGSARELLLGVSFDRLRPLVADDTHSVPGSVGAAVAALAGWCLAAVGGALLRVRARDA